MKKLIAVLTVLLMASVAQAGLILTIEGEPAPDEITLAPSDWIELDVDITAGENITGIQVDVRVDSPAGLLDSSGVVYPSIGFMLPIYTLNSGPHNLEFTGGNFSPVNGPLVLMQGLMFHCETLDEVLVTVVVTGDTTIDGEAVAAGTVLDSLVIYQPEPMTVILLGLGGLFLRRRK